MNDIQKHRGPDDTGIWANQQEFIGLAHNRLSILDLTDCGHQPMKDSETGNVVCFNGEIYNYIELRKEIGGIFRTNTDTEVILKAYEKWGTGCVTHFKGMFSFAIWDEKIKYYFVQETVLALNRFIMRLLTTFFILRPK